MGITVTGDIILILKHAKVVGGRIATDKALEVAPRKEIPATSSAAVNLPAKKTVSIINAPAKSINNPVVSTKPTLSKTTSLVTVGQVFKLFWEFSKTKSNHSKMHLIPFSGETKHRVGCHRQDHQQEQLQFEHSQS